MVSGQYGPVFTRSQYDKIKKVYSIWICTDVPENLRGTITKYETQPVHIVGHATVPQSHYDLMTPVIVCLGENSNPDENKSLLLDMLNYLMLNDTDNYEQKRERLESDFAVTMTPHLEKGLTEMCNISQGVFERGELKKAVKIALNLLTMKLSLADIVKATELSPDEVRQIAKDNGLSVV